MLSWLPFDIKVADAAVVCTISHTPTFFPFFIFVGGTTEKEHVHYFAVAAPYNTASKNEVFRTFFPSPAGSSSNHSCSLSTRGEYFTTLLCITLHCAVGVQCAGTVKPNLYYPTLKVNSALCTSISITTTTSISRSYILL